MKLSPEIGHVNKPLNNVVVTRNQCLILFLRLFKGEEKAVWPSNGDVSLSNGSSWWESDFKLVNVIL